MLTKKCNSCMLDKELDSFSHNRTGRYKYGRHSICKECLKKTRNHPARTCGTKECAGCSKILDVSYYYKCRTSNDGLQSLCKQCQKLLRESNQYTRGSNYKKCRKCSRTLPPTEFCTNKRIKDGLATYCKLCDVLRKYHLDYKLYNQMCIKQHNKCLLCDKVKKLVVDHNHATGHIRGLLCSSCNGALGVFNDSIEILNKAILYLKGN